jgi:hypothetical protein
METVLETERAFVVQLVSPGDKRFLLLAKRGLADPAELGAPCRTLANPRPTAG